MSDKWNPPNAPNVKQDFEAAAKEQVNKTIPPPSDKGISTKAELDKRTEQTRTLREMLERRNAPAPRPNNEIAKKTEEEKHQKTKIAYEENERTKQLIKQRLEQKKKQEMHREFNRAAVTSPELEK
jgi:hypothetical protein